MGMLYNNNIQVDFFHYIKLLKFSFYELAVIKKDIQITNNFMKKKLQYKIQ